jgi:hypothetical protein
MHKVDVPIEDECRGIWVAVVLFETALVALDVVEDVMGSFTQFVTSVSANVPLMKAFRLHYLYARTVRHWSDIHWLTVKYVLVGQATSDG